MSSALEKLYATRFSKDDRVWKRQVWSILWNRVFVKWVKPADVLLDLGAGYCEFINSAVAARRIAVDLNPETQKLAAPGVEVRANSAEDLSFLADGSVDVVFSSNFLEHLPSKEVLTRVLLEAGRILRPGGTILLMGPNIRYLADRYWDYFDHHLALSHESLSEVLMLHGFELTQVEPKFLPYTVKNKGPRWRWLVELYLLLRPISSGLLGKQFLIAARREAATPPAQ